MQHRSAGRSAAGGHRSRLLVLAQHNRQRHQRLAGLRIVRVQLPRASLTVEHTDRNRLDELVAAVLAEHGVPLATCVAQHLDDVRLAARRLEALERFHAIDAGLDDFAAHLGDLQAEISGRAGGRIRRRIILSKIIAIAS